SHCFHSAIIVSYPDPATTAIYTLSLHDALPISTRWPTSRRWTASASSCGPGNGCWWSAPADRGRAPCCWRWPGSSPAPWRRRFRSEEHTSELQSRENLVCRLLLEKKNRPRQPGP